MSTYQEGYDAGYAAGYADGQQNILQMKQDELRNALQAAMDARVEAVLRECGIAPLPEQQLRERIAAKKAFAAVLLADTPAKRMMVCDAEAKPVYQGRLVHCASCGKPVGDSPVQKDEYGCIFLYCSPQCRDYHAVGA
jgi:hypothetical protein